MSEAMMHTMEHAFHHAVEHTLEESIRLLPFLLVTYIVMEYIEQKMEDKAQYYVQRSGKLGPVIGGILGAFPQCGFSAAASNLYAGKVITLGTLIAIFLSTSDEMLPILISAKVAPALILKILGTKILIGTAAGFLIDLVLAGKRQDEHVHIHEMCEKEHCHCDQGIWQSALIHTLKITGFIILITFGLNLVLHNGGEEVLSEVLMNRPVVGPLIAGLVGLVPNCASSIVLTQLYVEGAMSFGTMIAGLLVGSGIGVLVLCRVNHDRKENLRIIALLYGIGVAAGIVLQLAG